MTLEELREKLRAGDFQLSKNFVLDEFCESQTAERLGIDNHPTNYAVVESLRELCLAVLEPTREFFGRPLAITSGFRCPPLNTAVHGQPNSQHILGEASDIKVRGVPNARVATWIRDNLHFDQLILEFPVRGFPMAGWVHVSYRVGRLRGEVLTIARDDGGNIRQHGGFPRWIDEV